MAKKLTVEEIIEKINKKCKEKNYSFLGFMNVGDISKINCNKLYLKLHCNQCGNDWDTTTYSRFINLNNGCPICNKGKLLTTDTALSNIQSMCLCKNISFKGFCDENGNSCEWHGTSTKLLLECNKCKYTWRTTDYHHFINSQNGCKNCGRQKTILSRKLQIANVLAKIDKICKKNNIQFLGFIDKEKKKIEYDTIKTTYLNLLCNKCGQIWNTCTVDNFFHNKKCPNCKTWILEENVFSALQKEKIHFLREYKIKSNEKKTLDFYIPEYHTAIECQGIQHFKPIDYFGGNKRFDIQLKNDERKRRLCEENGIRLLYYSNLGIEYPYKVYEDLDELIEEIKTM